MANAVLRYSLAAVFAACSASVTWADENQPQAEILHWWATSGEAAALSVFINEFESRGGLYYDSSKNNEVANREEAIERMGKGYPATLTQWNAGNDLVELYDYGLLKPIQLQKIVQRLMSTLPAPVLDVVSHRGDIIAIPLNIHSENWMWYSQKHLGKTQFDLSGDWSKLLQTGNTLAEKNIPLLAIGNQPWQVRILFTSIFLGVSRDRYKEFYITNDVSVVDTDELRKTLEVFNKLAGYSESFGDGNWNTQVKAVAENRAAANFMGDWARGEFMTHDQQVGVDYGCQLTSKMDPSLLMVVDTLVLGNVFDDSEVAGQELMLDVVSDADISLKFNALKGSVSPYAKPDSASLDVCTSQVYAALKNTDAIIPPYQSYFSNGGDYAEHIDHAIYELWSASLQSDHDANELIERTLERFRTILERRAKQLVQTATVED